MGYIAHGKGGGREAGEKEEDFPVLPLLLPLADDRGKKGGLEEREKGEEGCWVWVTTEV